MPKNIDDFNAMAGLILAHLYGTFPHRINMDETTFVPAEGIAEGWWERYHSAKTLYVGTATWLKDAGYIWISEQNGMAGLESMHGIFRGCVLSPKGLEALKAMPPNLSGESFGDSLRQAAKTGALDSLKGIASELVTQSYKAMLGIAAAHI